jgi:putative transposase
MAKFRNKYRIESARLQGWDYRNPGAYFITICTHRRIHHFGECKNGKMKLSTIGLIVQGCWYQIPHYNHHVRLGEFIVMPNHIHGVLILDEMEGFNDIDISQNHAPMTGLSKNEDDFYRKIMAKSGSVSVMLGSFKSACSRHIHQTFPSANFEWQELFHDHIIRNEASFVRISNYILNNPLKWNEDRFNDEK